MLINKRIGRDQGESQGTLPNRVEIFKWLLRNKMDKTNSDREQRGKGRVTESIKTRLKS